MSKSVQLEVEYVNAVGVKVYEPAEFISYVISLMVGVLIVPDTSLEHPEGYDLNEVETNAFLVN